MKISTTVNALATPVISLISVVLLYLTLSKQIESNYFQKKAKNLDLILVMYNQLQVEYGNFTYNKKGQRAQVGVTTHYEDRFHGFDALFENLQSIRKKPEKFGPSYQSDKIVGLIHTFDLVQKLILNMDLEKDAQNELGAKMKNFYQTSFRPTFLDIAFHVRNNTNINSKILIDFVTNQEQKENPAFDINTFKSIGELFKDHYNNNLD
ncbi:hypothetical protein [Pedobacter antarcticus]|uniref:hypothetical protein n=1 Tax=Pedobacter antarcticus TaxID=34086 RepID=UPI00094304DE|nr:hypothetical protein [Pedobacter antarcticus]